MLIPRLQNTTTEEVMDKLDMFQERFVKIDKFFWWDMEIIQTGSGTQFTSKGFQEVFQYVEYDLN